MSFSSDDITAALLLHLNSDPDILDLVTGVFDGPMKGQEYPYITFGSVDVSPDEFDCVDGENHTLQIDVWSRLHGKLAEASRICTAVKVSLNDAELETGDTGFCECRVTARRAFHEPDGIGAHGIVTVEIQVTV